MADERDTPSLEPPSLFGRKKKPAAPPQPAAPPAVSRPARRPVEVDDTPTTIFDDSSEPTPDVGPSLVSDEVPTPARTPRGRWLRGRPAAVVTGLLVGALIVGATAGSLRICTKVKGTSSCGDQGFFLLVAILVVAVLVGTAVLRVAHVPEPGSISFLAVGLLSVVTLLFLVDSIFEWWMVIAIPLVSVAMFLAAHWVATTYIDPAA